MNIKIQKAVAQLVNLLVESRYEDIELFTHSVRLTADEMAKAVAAYGHTLVVPPASGWNQMNTVAVRNSSPQRWSVVMPLWTEEEGRSDLSLECTAIEDCESIKLELDDIHVL